MRWWFVTFQALILAGVAVAAGLVHASISPERSNIEDFIPAWYRQAAREAQAHIDQRTAPPDQPIPRQASNSDNAAGDHNASASNDQSANPDDPATTDANDDVSGNGNVAQIDGGANDSTSGSEGAPAIDLANLPEDIELEQAKALWDDGQAVFVDARAYHEYKEGHIEYAISIPYDVIREKSGLPTHVREGIIDPASTTLVIYCIGGNCDESLLVAQELKGIGFKCHVYVDGYPAWKNAGYPVAEGPDGYLVEFNAEPPDHDHDH